MDELVVPYDAGDVVRARLSQEGSWPRRWSAAWRVGGDEVVWPVRDMASVPLAGTGPVRRFSWRAGQRHRPGLQFLVSTGRHHGFESLEEARLLSVLDFVRAAEVFPQPFRMSFEHEGGRSEHTPDFLALMPDGGRWLFDVRPRPLVGEEDALKFAASGEAASVCGWRYTVVTGWRPNVLSVLDALSAQRRPLQDPLGLQRELEAAAMTGPSPFGRLVERTRLPAVARAHALHLLWHRRLGVDLGRPLTDATLVWRRGETGGGT
ncbi:TnsA-like heteromeric transposase endonuclease subunit [Streptomyces sp. NPDC058525]|uniref:TnsA-like heteromeric transposase endonuclease subunit n=1 Tax=Streptomyces sp. NPDC058525 TaxID=3346538 RepID=UPI00364EDB04